MDGYEATRIVLSRIQNLEPQNASKIMGLLLMQDHGEKEMIRLAFGPETLLHSVILKAKKELGLVPTISRQNTSSSSSSRLIGSSGVNLPYLSIPNNPSATFSWNSLSDIQNPDELMSPSLAFHGNGVTTSSMLDELQLQDHDLFYPQAADACDPNGFPSYWGSSSFQKSNSTSDIIGADDPGSEIWWRPCLYYARGYCKNGNNCRFIHGEVPGAKGGNIIGSPNKIEMMEQCHELLRSKSACQKRLTAASQLMGSPPFAYSPNCMNLANDSQRAAAAAAALMVGDEYDTNKFNRSRLERNGFSIKGETGMVNPGSRQIYLTFPADSTFREEDVSNYFSIYGPVQDVRIPYQQKRMFGFVTFLYAETVKIILAKGNPHFVCDARVLVKPYKEKGKIPDKKQPQMERGEFSPCGTPTGLDSIDPFDLQLGARMFYNNQDMLWRRKLAEQNGLEQALELQNRRLMGLQLVDVKKHQHQRGLSSGSPIPSSSHPPSLYGQSLVLPQFHSSQDAPQENCSSPMPAISVTAPDTQTASTAAASSKEPASTAENGSEKERPHCEDSDLPESLEYDLPDSPFASPAKATGEISDFSSIVAEKDALVPSSSVDNNWISSTLFPANNAIDISSINTFNFQLPRLSSGHGTIGMYARSGGPTCPVGI